MIRLVQLLTTEVPPHLRGPEISFLLLVASAAVVAWKLAGGLRGGWFQLAICVVLMCDVCTFAYRVIPFDKPPNIFPRNELFDRLSRIEEGPFRLTNLGTVLPANVQLMYGLRESGGYEIPLARIKKFSAGLDENAMDSMFFETDKILDSKDRRADLLNTKYYVMSRYDRSYEKFLELRDRFYLRFEYGDTVVFENMKAFPPAFLVEASGINIIPDETDQLARIKDPLFDPAKSVILPEPMAVSSTTRDNSATGAVRWIERRNNSFRLNVETQNDSVLVISQTYYPGWKAWVDGQETRIVPADYALTAIIVGAGSHDVRFSYQPMSFRMGLIISLASLLVAILLVTSRRTIFTKQIPDHV